MRTYGTWRRAFGVVALLLVGAGGFPPALACAQVIPRPPEEIALWLDSIRMDRDVREANDLVRVALLDHLKRGDLDAAMPIIGVLEHAAATSDDFVNRMFGVVNLVVAARATSHPFGPQITARLLAVARSAQAPAGRSTIVGVVPDLPGPRPERLQFLRQQAMRDNEFVTVRKALLTLCKMGDDGRDVLRQLHTEGGVVMDDGGRYLGYLATNDFHEPGVC